jgi:hypothetical protein
MRQLGAISAYGKSPKLTHGADNARVPFPV